MVRDAVPLSLEKELNERDGTMTQKGKKRNMAQERVPKTKCEK